MQKLESIRMLFEHVADMSKCLQVFRGDFGRREKEGKQIDRSIVNGLKIDALHAAAKTKYNVLEACNFAMGNGHPVADTGGANLLPLKQGRVESCAVQVVVIFYSHLCKFFERRFLVRSLHVEKNALLFELEHDCGFIFLLFYGV